MPHARAQLLADGRPTHQILAIEERYDALTIVVGPRCLRWPVFLGAIGVTFVGAAMLLLVLAMAVTASASFPLAARLTLGGLFTLALAGVVGFFAAQLRRRVNYHTVTVADGIITLAGGPIWPTEKTLQLAEGDALRAAAHERGMRIWPWKSTTPEPVTEFGIDVSGTRAKSEWDVELVPPFTLSRHEAEKLATLMQKFAFPRVEEALIGSRM